MIGDQEKVIVIGDDNVSSPGETLEFPATALSRKKGVPFFLSFAVKKGAFFLGFFPLYLRVLELPVPPQFEVSAVVLCC